MFTTLVESRASSARRVGGTVVSALVHGALIAGAVALTLPPTVRANTTPPEPPPIWTIPINHPPEPPAQPPQGETHRSGPAGPRPPGPIDIEVLNPVGPVVDIVPGPVTSDPPFRSTISSGSPIGSGAPGSVGGGEAWDSHAVDRSPGVVGHPAEPRYPASLRAAGIEGRVVMQFVVDTTGRAEMGDVTVMEATHPQFAEAVQQVLRGYRFTPGIAAGRPVRTRVQIPFTFTLSH